MEEFEEYLKITFGVKNGTAGSYKNAIIILNNIIMFLIFRAIQ